MKKNIIFISTLLISNIIISYIGLNMKTEKASALSTLNIQNTNIHQNKEVNLPKIVSILDAEEKQRQEEEKKLAQQKRFQQTQDDISNYINSYLGSTSNIGFSFYNTVTGESFNINGDKVFTGASTIKVPLNVLICDRVQKGELSFDNVLTYTRDAYEEGTGIIQGQPVGSKYSIKDLSKLSITHSDNIATNMLIGTFGTYSNFRNQIDSIVGQTDHSGNYISPNQMMAMLKRLYTNPDNNPYYATLIDNMKNTIFHDRMDKYIPQEIVAHKIGNYGAYVNDVGIIYTKEPILVSFYTENLSQDKANEIIAQCSKILYDIYK